MALDPRLLTVLACPIDKGPLHYFGDDEGLYNPRLRRRYPVRDGIPVMLPDESIQVGDDDADEIDRRIAAGEGTATGDRSGFGAGGTLAESARMEPNVDDPR